MKLSFLLFAVCLGMLSCRTEDPLPERKEESFFNLNVGNKWVYKTYVNPDFTNPQSTSTFSGRIDSVSIVSIVNIQGLTFAKQRTKINFQNSNLNGNVNYQYLRVNAKGHLVSYPALDNIQVTETGGHVLHPGQDFTYTFNNPISDAQGAPVIGNVLYKLQNEAVVNVEGNNYNVFPYKGEFTPVTTANGLLPKTQDISYKKGLGLVKEICHSVYSKSFFETRLVSVTIIK